MGGLRGWVVHLLTGGMWQEAGEGLQTLSDIHGHCACFPSNEPKQKALLVTGVQSHTFQLRFEALSPLRTVLMRRGHAMEGSDLKLGRSWQCELSYSLCSS